MQDLQEFNYIGTFPPLGHPEHHFNKYPNHPWLKNVDEIKEWVVEMITFINVSSDKPVQEDVFRESIVVNEDLTISLMGEFKVRAVSMTNDIEIFPVQFRQINNFIYYSKSNSNLSLIGTPYTGSVFIKDFKIQNLEGLSGKLSSANLSNNSIESFEGMDRFYKEEGMLNLLGNKIISWDGFTSCERLIFWQKEWCDKTSLKLILNTPKSINHLYVSSGFDNDFLEVNAKKATIKRIDLDWLRAEQDKVKTIELKEKIDLEFDVGISGSKRKI